ncbi:hypothetical protein [Massilia aurea]|uniref:hypothetical protein n=1 Tax=Massilia aurea TaxID=373040 RepID=UPI00161B2692|nr:hypothetical protein [Massilia aurea]
MRQNELLHHGLIVPGVRPAGIQPLDEVNVVRQLFGKGPRTKKALVDLLWNGLTHREDRESVFFTAVRHCMLRVQQIFS